MRIDLLGPLRVHGAAGAAAAVPAGRQRALLARLALDAGRVVSAAALIDAAWGDDPPANAAGALHTQLSRLRRTLGPALRTEPGGYRLDAATDLGRFERLAARAETAARDREPSAVRQSADEALALWRGPALAEFADARFADTARVRLTARRETVAALLIDARLELEGAEAVLAELAERAWADPLAETETARYMRALAAVGRRAEALDAYAKLRERLAEELGVDPSPVLAEAHLEVLRGTPAPAPEPASGLPVPLTACIGREADLAAIDALMAAGRLVTVTGPGGTGKTRLAIEAARLAADRGLTVRLAELAPLTDPLRLPDLLAESLRIGDSILARRPDNPRDRLVEALRSRSMLLVVDNCEHLIEAVAALLAHLLPRAPGLRVLTTSREALGIAGEAVYPLGPLSLPEPGEPPAALETHAAVRLFAERGRQSDPAFAITEANAALAARVCTALDGLPLAIELAAARLRSMSLDDLADRLDDRFNLLTRGDRTAAPRQRTLRGVVDWSWNLLDPAERRLLARMSVFNGSADLDAVTGICSAPVDLVAGLVEKSLVQRLPSGRYRLLETIREYAAARLTELGETDRLYLRHCDHYADLAKAAEPHLMRAEQIEWLDRLGAEHGNLTAAIRRMIAAGNAAAAHRIMAPLGWYWWMKGHRREGQELAPQVRALEGDADPADRAMVGMSGTWGLWSGELDPAVIASAWEDARKLAESAGLYETVPLMRVVPALLALVADDEDALRRSLADAETPAVRGMILLFCSGYSERAGDLERAEAELAESNAIFEALGERFGLLMTLQALAGASEARGDYGEARRLLARALRIESEFGVDDAQSVVIENLWRLDAEYGDDPEAALARMREARARAAEAGNAENLLSARVSAAVCLHRLGRLEKARDELLAAEADRPRYVQFSEVSMRLYRQLGQVADELGDSGAARRAAECSAQAKWPFSQ